jgi:hypothetical protein
VEDIDHWLIERKLSSLDGEACDKINHLFRRFSKSCEGGIKKAGVIAINDWFSMVILCKLATFLRSTNIVSAKPLSWA